MHDKQKLRKEMFKDIKEELKRASIGNNTICYNFNVCKRAIRSKLMNEPCTNDCKDRVVSIRFLKITAIKRIALMESLKTIGTEKEIEIRCDELKKFLNITDKEIEQYFSEIAGEI